MLLSMGAIIERHVVPRARSGISRAAPGDSLAAINRSPCGSIAGTNCSGSSMRRGRVLGRAISSIAQVDGACLRRLLAILLPYGPCVLTIMCTGLLLVIEIGL